MAIMWKWAGWLPVAALAGLLAACSTLAAPTATPRPTPVPITAKEAYERARPVMLAWHEDAVVTAAIAGCCYWYTSDEGRASSWSFEVNSAAAMRFTMVYASATHSDYGMDNVKDLPMSDRDLRSLAWRAIPIDELMDSDEAVIIALQNGVSPDDRLVRIELRARTDGETRFWWELGYGEDPHDWPSHKKICIDARTGEVGCNDFAE